MSQARDTFLAGAASARSLAEDYRIEAETTTDPVRREKCLQEAVRHDERADWYEQHASLFQPHHEYREAAE